MDNKFYLIFILPLIDEFMMEIIVTCSHKSLCYNSQVFNNRPANAKLYLYTYECQTKRALGLQQAKTQKESFKLKAGYY